MSHGSTAPAFPSHPHTNRLAGETSPYLLQHQHNPVDWYPWGPEAFERARREDKPIFLSVGYSTCYWCHVMERQCFEDGAVAAEMNARFVNVKVDREERPDVDQLYMTAVQVLTRHGGWPMSVWLTPDLRPFYGGTYYPPQDQPGRPGFVTVLKALDDAYRNRRAEVERTADELVNILRRVAEPDAPRRAVTVDPAFVDHLIERSTSDYDPTHGGFGHAPKFPRQTLLELLLVYLRPEHFATGGADAGSQPREAGAFPGVARASRPGWPSENAGEIPAQRRDDRDPSGAFSDAARRGAWQREANAKMDVRKRVLHTLDALAAGGIRDQLGGGFHRYSTDERWLVPHFEIMLYDNALLAWCYVEAFRQTREPRYASVARGVFDFVLREMTSPDGAFYTAFDAEVDGQEGLNYLWTPEEVTAVLGEGDAKLFNHVYGLDRGFNFADPHHGDGRPDKNILYLPESLEHVHAGGVAGLDAALEPMRRKLKAVRDRRKQPLLDTKVLTSWNALMIRALACGGQVLGDQRYLDAAARAAEFLLAHHRTPSGGLYRTSRDGRAKYEGFLDDYAYLVQAMLALDEAGAGPEWLGRAGDLARAMVRRFGDDSGAGGYFFTDRDASDLIVRQKTGRRQPAAERQRGRRAGAARAGRRGRRPGDARRLRGPARTQRRRHERAGASRAALPPRRPRALHRLRRAPGPSGRR
jgi:uncharacterized protein YyaL (SSP411 family)